jgi:hypothetical protein
MGLNATEIQPAHTSSYHEFEQWLLGIPPIAHEKSPIIEDVKPATEAKQIGFGF